MDGFLLFGIIGFSGLITSFVAYKVTTDKIIKEQEKEIATLNTENRRLHAALRGARHVEVLEISDRPARQPKAIVRVTGQPLDFPNSKGV